MINAVVKGNQVVIDVNNENFEITKKYNSITITDKTITSSNRGRNPAPFITGAICPKCGVEGKIKTHGSAHRNRPEGYVLVGQSICTACGYRADNRTFGFGDDVK